MQTKRKRTETISETATVVFVKNANTGVRTGWCIECGADVLWIAIRALGLFGITGLPVSSTLHPHGDEICSRALIKKIKGGEIYEQEIH